MKVSNGLAAALYSLGHLACVGHHPGGKCHLHLPIKWMLSKSFNWVGALSMNVQASQCHVSKFRMTAYIRANGKSDWLGQNLIPDTSQRTQ